MDEKCILWLNNVMNINVRTCTICANISNTSHTRSPARRSSCHCVYGIQKFS